MQLQKDKINEFGTTLDTCKEEMGLYTANVCISFLPNEVHAKNINGKKMMVPTFQTARSPGVIALPFKHNLGEDTQLIHHLFLSVTVRDRA